MTLESAWPTDPHLAGHTLRSSGAPRVAIGHALVDNCSSLGVCSSIIDYARNRGKSAYVITPNAQHIVLLEREPEFRKVYREADLVLADGASLLLAARLYGRVLQERVAGVDTFSQLCGMAAQNGLRVFLLGGLPGSAERAADVLCQRFPGFLCNTYCPPYGFEQSRLGLQRVEDAVVAARPHLLFVGFGAPKQEYWIYNHGRRLSVPISIGVGGSFEMVSGAVARAPKWMQEMACEWVFRFCQEPRRLWHRYLIGNLQFGNIVLRQRGRRLLLDACLQLASQGRFAAELEELSTTPQASAQPNPLLQLLLSQLPPEAHDPLPG